MRETWLKQNGRVTLFVGALLAGVIAACATPLFSPIEVLPPWLQAVLATVAMLAAGLLVAVGLAGLRPRLAFAKGNLLVNIRRRAPYQVPIEFVEGFLLGQSPAQIPGEQHQRIEARSLSIKLADRAEQWQRQDTFAPWGKWCGGYITICGTWCEPLSLELVQRLNRRLAEVQARRDATPASAKSCEAV